MPPHFRDPRLQCGFSRIWRVRLALLYVAYLDEFGHVGPYLSRDDSRFNDSPAFGLGGFVIPHEACREFSGWFYRLRNDLLDFEIKRDAVHPSRWEKKGSALLTSTNVEKYPQLTRAMKRIFSKIHKCGGFVVYAGFEKSRSPNVDSRGLYGGVLRRILLKIHRACCTGNSKFMVLLDDNDRTFSREVILRKAQQVMFGDDRCHSLIETPLQKR